MKLCDFWNNEICICFGNGGGLWEIFKINERLYPFIKLCVYSYKGVSMKYVTLHHDSSLRGIGCVSLERLNLFAKRHGMVYK